MSGAAGSASANGDAVPTPNTGSESIESYSTFASTSVLSGSLRACVCRGGLPLVRSSNVLDAACDNTNPNIHSAAFGSRTKRSRCHVRVFGRASLDWMRQLEQCKAHLCVGRSVHRGTVPQTMSQWVSLVVLWLHPCQESLARMRECLSYNSPERI